MKFTINLPLRNAAQLDALLNDLYDPHSADFHHYLSVSEFTERFSPSAEDYARVVAWAKANGFAVRATSANRRLVHLAGPVEAINRALNIHLNFYQHPSEPRRFFAPDREPTIQGLDVPLLQITGLNNFVLPRPKLKRSTSSLSHALNGSGPSGTYLPSDMRAVYYGSGALTGAGQTVGIFSFDGYLSSDLPVYFKATGMSSNVPISNVLVAGYDGSCVDPSTGQAPCDDGEQILDIVNVLGMAPGLSSLLFYEGEDDTEILNQMAVDNLAKVISCSWGWSPGDASSDDPIFKEFAAQGQTFVNATGDDGQFNSKTYAFPSVDANVLQVGGTVLTTSGAGGTWVSEVGWPYSGGGYVSSTAIPSWQQISGVITPANQGSTKYRNAPDVAAEADFDNSTVSNGQFETGFGGTSYAAPRWAGFLALVNQQANATGHGSVGFINAALTPIGLGAQYSANFHDITSGNNAPDLGSGSGFNAVAGYDLVTGWGSPQAGLINTLVGVDANPGPDFSLTVASPTLTITAGATQSIAVSVVPVDGFNSSVSLSLSGLPTNVSATFTPSSTSSVSTLQLTATSAALAQSVSVTISGNAGALTHTVGFTLTVVPATTPPGSAAYVALVPARLLDTRTGAATVDGQFAAGGALPGGQTLNLSILGRGEVPSTGVTAVVLNVTVTNPAAAGFVTAWPAGSAQPTASNLNFTAGQTIPNLVVAKIGSNGQVSLRNSGAAISADLIADVVGYFTTSAAFTPVSPARLLDTRTGFSTVDGQFNGVGALGSHASLDLTVSGRAGLAASGVGAVILNVTATRPTAAAFLTVWPADQTRPLTSNLNVVPGLTVPNLVISQVSASGAVALFNSAGNTDVIADIQGWFPATSELTSVAPARLLDTRSGATTIDGQFAATGALPAHGSVDLVVAGRGTIPASGVAAVVLNVTATNPTAAGFLTAWPTGSSRPLASNLNFVPGQTIPNLVIAKVGTSGKISLFNSAGSTDVIADVVGWFPAP